MESIPTMVFVKHGAVAVFGAITQALIENREGRSKGFLDFCILFIVGSFSGLMFGLFSMNFFPNNQWVTLSITGGGAVMGQHGLSILVKHLLEMIKIAVNKK